jgi:uncharacterized protein DUF5907
MDVPWRREFDAARDPYTARNALGITTTGGGGGAPTTAEYITASTDPTLTNERVLTNTASITWDFSTPGQAKASTVAGGGNVSNSGTPTVGQYAKWVTSTTIQGVAPATVLSDIGAQPAGSYQPLDPDLTSLAGAASTNAIYYRSAANTWGPITVGTGLSFSSGTLTCTVSTAGLAPLASPVFTGDPQAPTPATGDNDTSIATTAFVKAQGYITSAAPTGAQYIVAATDATLTAERVGTNSTSITWDFGTAGQALVKRAALTGDVTAAIDSNATTIANDAVTYAKMQNVSATARIIGRKTAAAGDPEECTLSEVLDFVGSAVQGDILYRGASTWTRLGAGTSGQFLKTQGASANPIWATLAGGGNVSNVGTPANGQLAQWTDSTHIQGINASVVASLVAAQNSLINGKVVESHASNAATFAVKTLTGADPSASDPVAVAFPDGSVLSITSALSLTIAAGVTLGTTTAIFRLWFAIINNSGTPLLAVKLCALADGSAAIFGYDARGVTSSSTPANTAWVVYASSAVTDKPYRVVAFADYETANPTAGNWSVSPTRIMMVGPNTPMPGDVVGYSAGQNFAQAGPISSAAYVNTNTTVGITLQSKLNPVRLRMCTNIYLVSGNVPYFVLLHRDSFAAKSTEQQMIGTAGSACDIDCTIEWFDWPLAVGFKQYYTAARDNDNASQLYLPGSVTGGYMSVEELMG